MKTKTLLPIALIALIVIGCTSFATHVFRTEQTATHLVYTAYVGYTNALPTLNITPQQSNEVKQARLRFAATVSTIDQLRLEYETNSAVKPQLQAVLTSLSDQASNLVWLISFVKQK